MNLQLIADKQNENRSQRRKDQPGRMITFVRRASKHVGNGSANNGADDSQHDRPKDSDVNVHNRFGHDARNQTDKDVPD